jgi:cytochrome c-type biogenesis protein CcmF
MGDEVVRGARARARSRDENPPVAVWRLATRNRRRYGGYLVHAGVCVMAVAVAVSATLASDVTATLGPGESVSLGAYTVSYDSLVIEPLPDDPRVTETRAELTLRGPQSGRLAPALRDYPNSTIPIATPTVRTAIVEDLYVTLLAYDPGSRSVTLHLFVNPLVVWIWVGGAIVALGAAFAVWPEPKRLPLPAAAGA